MSLPLLGYTTCGVLRASPRTRVYEVKRDSDGHRAIAKVFRTEGGGIEARVRHEFRLLEALDIEGVVRPVALERVGDSMVLLLDYVEGENLRCHVNRRALSTREFLPIARRLVSILARVHERGIVHRDIKPSNILIQRSTGAIYLADFGISTLLEEQQRHIYEAEVLEGTLPYLSPEQTGRTKRSVDFRSDLYSLGVTFYELLTGRLPLDASAPLELVHAHLARRPAPVRSLQPDVPELLSAIVTKLLEKAPEFRYQSAAGLLADLEQLERELAQGNHAPDFPLGRHDNAGTLQFPAQLYGRQAEVDLLAAELRAVTRERARRVVYIEGEAGVGKSALIHSLEVPLAAAEGYLAAGSFARTGSHQLYAGIVEAFEGLLEQTLTEDDASLERWRQRLSDALGPLAGVVAALVPTLGLVLGELPPAPPLAPAEARNRLHLAFGRLLTVFAETAPLLFVLDDLHQADPASLELLSTLALDASAPMLLILAGRPQQAGAAGLEELLSKLGERSCPVTRVHLETLREAELVQLLVDALGRSPAELGELPDLIARKTDRNPLLVRQFLAHLISLRLLVPDARGWSWDAEAITKASLPDDAVSMLEARIARLSERPRRLLSQAAHIGARFDTGLLTAISGRDPASVSEDLHLLESDGLIDPLPRGHRFAHEQLVTIARALTGAEDSRRLHARIGAHLLERLGRNALGERIFEVVDQLDAGHAGRALPEDERLEHASLNVEAGQRALDSADWASALRYFNEAAARLEPEFAAVEAGRDHHPLALAAAFGQAQTLALTGEIEAAEARFETLARWRLELSDYAEVTARRLHVLLLRGRGREALAIGRAALRRCGVVLPERCGKLRIGLEVFRAWRGCRAVTAEQWQTRPELDDPRARAQSKIFDALETVAYLEDRQLFVLLSAIHARIAAGEALDPHAGVALSQLAIAVAIGLRKPADAARLCDRALELCERPFITARARAEAAALLFVWPTSRAWHEYTGQLPALVEHLREAGDRDLHGFSMAIGLAQLFEAGTHLANVLEQGRSWQAELDRWGTPEMTLGCAMTVGLAALLAGEHDDIDELVGRERGLEVGASEVFVVASVACHLCAHTLLGQPEQGFAELEEVVEGFERAMFGSWQATRLAMWAAIVDSARFASGASAAERRRITSRMTRYVRELRRWAKGCPDNFSAMLDIAIAERERVRGRPERALAAYERARLHAAGQGNTGHEALAALRMAELAEALERHVLARGAYECALRAFRRWGARAVVARLELRLREGELDLGDAASDSNMSETLTYTANVSSSSSVGTPASTIDLATVVETMNLISEELRLDEVVVRVLAGAITSAGADRGVLLLERGGVVSVVAEGDSEQTRSRDQSLAEHGAQLPQSVVNYVLRTGVPVILDDARSDPRFAGDPYIRREELRSLLCMPIIKQHRRVGALVLENRLTSHGFPSERLQLLRFLVAQAASALDNARLYDALQRSEARWRSLVDGAPDTIMVMDTTGSVEFVNDSGAAPPTQALLGNRYEELLNPNYREHWRHTLAEVVNSQRIRELEVSLAGGGGEPRWHIARIAPIDGGERLLAIVTDISERKGLEAQVRQHQRIESLGTLASGVAHEINNPIQGIMNYAELIAEREEASELIREFAHEINDESERVAHIVRDLLTFSRQEHDEALEWIAPKEIVGSTLSLVQALMRKDGVDLRVDVPAELPRVRCRPQQIRQIVMNLITNARDVLNERFEGFDEDKQIAVRGAQVEREGRSWLSLEVEDHGGGIPEGVRDRIFDPFFTTKGRDRGTGLGLAVSHGIAVEHGGQLNVRTELGVGTTFELLLPLDPEHEDG